MLSEEKGTARQTSIPNNLEKDSEKANESNKSRSGHSSFKETGKSKDSGPKDDIIDKFLRSCYAIVPAIITSGTIAGLLEVAQDWVITAGSPSMVGLTIASFCFWYWIIKRIDFRKKS